MCQNYYKLLRNVSKCISFISNDDDLPDMPRNDDQKRISMMADESDLNDIALIIEEGRFTSRSGFIRWAMKCLLAEYSKELNQMKLKKRIIN